MFIFYHLFSAIYFFMLMFNVRINYLKHIFIFHWDFEKKGTYIKKKYEINIKKIKYDPKKF